MSQTGFAFDVGTVLGIGTPDSSQLPEPAEGEIILRVSEGLSLLSLRDSKVGRYLLHKQDGWYKRNNRALREVLPGVYRLRIPVPRSYDLTFSEQVQLLFEEEAVAPVAAVAAALLCMQQTSRPDPLAGRWTRCDESTGPAHHFGLSWLAGRLSVVAPCDDTRFAGIVLSSLRKTS